MVEVITIGETMAVFSPKTKGPLRYVADFHLRIAGAESNTAIGLEKLGHHTAWVSSLGRDELGHFILNTVRSEGVDASNVRFDQEHRSGVMIKQINEAGETAVFYYREHSAFSYFSPKDLDEEMIRGAKLLHLTGITPVLSQSCRETVFAAAEIAQAAGISISFDPNIRKKLWESEDYTPMLRDLAARTDVLLLGRDEAETLYGETEPEAIAKACFQNSRITKLAIKDGGNGAWAAEPGQLCRVYPHPCHPVDPIGAGDAFNAAFLSGVLENAEISLCGRMGAVAGAMATQTDGDVEGQPSRTRLQKILDNKTTVYR